MHMHTRRRNTDTITALALAVVLFGVLTVVVGGYIYKKVAGLDSLGDATFLAYTLLNNVPGADASTDEVPYAVRAARNALYLVGVFTFAILLGVVTDTISTKVDEVRFSNEPVLETDHTLLLNWGEYTRPMLRQVSACLPSSAPLLYTTNSVRHTTSPSSAPLACQPS